MPFVMALFAQIVLGPLFAILAKDSSGRPMVQFTLAISTNYAAGVGVRHQDWEGLNAVVVQIFVYGFVGDVKIATAGIFDPAT